MRVKEKNNPHNEMKRKKKKKKESEEKEVFMRNVYAIGT